MCLTTVYSDTNGFVKEIMRDVVRIEAEDTMFRISDMFGKEQCIEGKLKYVDFWKDHSAVIAQVK